MAYNSLISIIIPVYNVEQFLDSCVESVCRQTYDDLEIILVDDGSTDASGEICDKWKEKDDRIVVIHKANGGPSDARNAALNIARGEYIGFVDADDTIDERMYEHLLQNLQDTGSDFVACAYRAVDEAGVPCKRSYEDIPDCIVTTAEYIKLINQNPRNHCALMVVWNKLYRKSLVKDLRFQPERIHEDEIFLNEILSRANRITILHTSYYNYLQRKGSLIHEEFSEKRLVYFYTIKDRLELCKKRDFDKECIEVVARECLNTGVRFWLVITKQKLVDKARERQFYEDVCKVKREYAQYGSFKQRIFWGMYDYTPWLLKGIYSAYKTLKKEKK